MKKNKMGIVWLSLILLLVLALAACNGLSGKPVAKNVLLQQRLQSYIEARKINNFDQLRKLYLKPENVRRGNIVVKESKVVWIKIADDELKAKTKIENKIQAMGFTFDNVPMLLDWVWQNDNWYIAPSQSPMNPFIKKKKTESGK